MGVDGLIVLDNLGYVVVLCRRALVNKRTADGLLFSLDSDQHNQLILSSMLMQSTT